MNKAAYITGDIDNYLIGEGRYGENQRPVIVCNSDLRIATGQIYCRLSQDRQYGFKIGKGLVKKGSDQQYRPLSFEEFEEACLSIFVFTRLQEEVGSAARCLEILDAPPKLFLVTCKQGRWSADLERLFPLVDGPKAGAFITQP